MNMLDDYIVTCYAPHKREQMKKIYKRYLERVGELIEKMQTVDIDVDQTEVEMPISRVRGRSAESIAKQLGYDFEILEARVLSEDKTEEDILEYNAVFMAIRVAFGSLNQMSMHLHDISPEKLNFGGSLPGNMDMNTYQKLMAERRNQNNGR